MKQGSTSIGAKLLANFLDFQLNHANTWSPDAMGVQMEEIKFSAGDLFLQEFERQIVVSDDPDFQPRPGAQTKQTKPKDALKS